MEEAAFLRAIAESPDDDAVRLVFADWLDEHGQPERAEFIRVQCQLAVEEPADRASADWFRQDDLATRHGAGWLAALPALEGITWCEFERGLPAVAEAANVPTFLRHADAIRSRTPVRRLHVHGTRPTTPELFRPGQLAGLVGLSLHFGGGRAAGLADCPEAAGLRELRLSDCDLGDEGAARLANSPLLAGLRRLDLHANSIRADGAAALAASPYLAGVGFLGLDGIDSENGTDNHIGTNGVTALAHSPHLRPHTLDLGWNNLRADAMVALSAGGALAGLRRLDLACNPLGPAGLVALAESPVLANLCELELWYTEGGPEGVAALAASPVPARLRYLGLYHAGIGPEGMAALAASSLLVGVADLGLSSNQLGDAGVRTLVASPHAAGLRRLNLALNELTDDAFRTLANAPALAGLVELDVSMSEASSSFWPNRPRTPSPTAAGIHALMNSACLRSLRRLWLRGNGLDTAAVRAMVGSRLSAQLTHLDLSYNPAIDTDEAGRLLADWPRLVGLTLSERGR